MSEENAAASVSPETIPAPAAAAEPAKTAEATTQPNDAVAPEAGAATEGAKPTEAEEAAKASEAAKALAARKQTAGERIAEMRRRAGEAERRAEAAERREAELRAKLKEPDPATFDDVSKLGAAQVAHTLDKRDADRLADEAANASKEADAAIREAWQERISVFKETATDFDEVAYRAPISDAVAKDILRMEEGPQIAYFLGKNPAQARDLNNLSERDRAIQLGRLAGRLSQAPARRISQAPTPVDAVGGKGAQSGSFDPSKASMEEYAAKRKAGWKG